MREGIHPDYYQATVTCNCGNTFVKGSTKEEIHVEKANRADGRIDKFNKKYGINKQKKVVTDKVEVIKSQPFLEHGNSMRKTWFLK